MQLNVNVASLKYISRYAGDWAVCVACQIYVFTIGLRTKPFLREFNIEDPSIQHPFTEHEQVTDWQCLIITTFIPGFILFLNFLSRINFSPRRLTQKEIHFTHISGLGLILSVTITGLMTVIVKNWISRPRPDFLARCVPDTSLLVPGKTTYTTDICTGTTSVILEGLRSTPSGHSSLAFSGLHYITLWMCVQFEVFASQFHIWKMLACTAPEWVAIWIALSRTQDYRHHFGDILMGGLLGVVVSHLMYKKMFTGKDPTYLQETEPTLPMYNTIED